MRNKAQSPVRPVPSVRERRLSFVLLGILISIALAIFAIHFRYDPAEWRAQPSQAALQSPVSVQATGPSTGEVPGLAVLSAPEYYDEQTLSDKINGKAELYLSAGFERLESRRFALSAHSSRWMELFIYAMTQTSGAFAVYSQQRRDRAQPLDLAADAYRSDNGIFLVQGRYYVEIIGSDSSAALMQKMTDLARAFIKHHPVAPASADERTLFPENGLVSDSIALTPENAFGFERLDRIFSARYRNNDQTAAAFLSRRASAAQAAELADAYTAYLLEYGGRRIDPPAGAPPVVVIEIMEMVEIVFHQGDLLAGIHEADDLPYALALAEQLYRNISEARREP
ncbi:MAG: hypothetical protein C4519_25340 [Desulfobacteraceae bacterium]|nr:MAG: hypothetical protein C4519_25340 [Desulfobacteraceae bacterium]